MRLMLSQLGVLFLRHMTTVVKEPTMVANVAKVANGAKTRVANEILLKMAKEKAIKAVVNPAKGAGSMATQPRNVPFQTKFGAIPAMLGQTMLQVLTS